MGGAYNRSLISAHFCISAYLLTAETYKRMRLTTRVYGNSTDNPESKGHILLCLAGILDVTSGVHQIKWNLL